MTLSHVSSRVIREKESKIEQNNGEIAALRAALRKHEDNLCATKPKPLLELFDNAQDQENLIYIIVSKKYPILYVGITAGGLHEGIFNRGRLKHHLNKLLAIRTSETSHTVGWNHHTKQRYEDNKIAFNIKDSDVDFRSTVLNDLYIAVGTSNDQHWEPKKHEGFVLSAAFETLSGYRQQLQILNTGAMSYEPLTIALPSNLKDFVPI